ncbi:MAG: efflux RND transporter permease subunit [Thermoanaerobaculia bacterium]
MSLRARAFITLGLLGLAALVAAAAWRVSKLEIRVHDLELLPAGAEVLAADTAIRETFGTDERVILALTSNRRAVTDPVFLDDLRVFSRAMGESFNIRQFLFDRLGRARFQPRAGQPWPLQPVDGPWLGAALERTATRGKLAAGRSRRTAFLEAPAFTASGVEDIERRARQALARLEERRPGEYTLRVIGRQVVLNGLGHALFEDLQRLVPWALLIVFVLFAWIFRSVWMAALALLQSGLCVLFTMAALQLLGHPVSITTAMIPVLLTVLGIADDLHLYSEYLRLRRREPEAPPLSLAMRGVRKVFFPCTATTLTTAIGFASFLPTDVPGLRVFGLLASIGVVISWLLTMSVVPVLLALIPIRKLPRWTLEPRAYLPPVLVRGAVPVLLSLLIVPGIARLRIEDGWTQNFRPDHPIVQDVRWFEKESVGVYQFDVLLTRADGRAWTEPDLLRSLAAFQARVEAAKEVTASLSLSDLVRDRAWELGDPAAERPPLPASRPAVEGLLRTYRLFNEEIFLRLFLDRDARSTRLLFATAQDDYGTSTRARETLDREIARAFSSGAAGAAGTSATVRSRVGGSAERGRVLIESITSSQGISVLASLAMSWLTLGFASGRWGTALRCILAIVWALALVLGIAGWAGVPLGVASSCFLALGVGVGLDYGIHLAFGRAATGHREGDGEEGAVHLRVLTNVLVVGIGLSVLMFSSNPTIARLGLLIVLSMAASGYTAIVAFAGDEIVAERLHRSRPKLTGASRTGLLKEEP